MAIDDPLNLVLALTASSVAKLLASTLWQKQKEDTFEYVGTVCELNLYPVKSCPPIRLESVRCSRTGFTHEGVSDRQWVVADQEGMSVTITHKPKMTQIKVTVSGAFLCLDAPGMPTLKLEKEPRLTNVKYKKCKVIEMTLTGIDCGEKASTWISTYLETPGLSLLVANTDIGGREVGELKRPWINVPESTDRVIFAGKAAVHITSEGSLCDLNNRLTHHVTMENFRPSISIKGTKPYDEDDWTELRIGNGVYMRILEPNSRCSVTTVNTNGQRNVNFEPLKTLRKYRKSPLYGDSPLFGINAAVNREGVINIGDPVYVLRTEKQII